MGGAIFDQEAMAQEFRHRVRWAAPVEMLPLADHDEAIAVWPNQHGRLETGQPDLEGRTKLITHDGQGR
jgi:hypothetical protein